MYSRKQYGQSREDKCPFCGKQAVTKNSQEIPVCNQHKTARLNDLKCVCGEWLDLKSGKWGPYFNCINCGNMNFRKGLEMNPGALNQTNTSSSNNTTYSHPPAPKPKSDTKKKEIVVRSDEVDFL